MDPLIIEAQEDSPGIVLDAGKGIYEISGESRPENVQGFFRPVMEWMEKFRSYTYWLKNRYPEKAPDKVDFHFKLVYFNSTSAKYILNILNLLSEINKETGMVNIYWHYEELDEDILKTGKAFEEIIDIKLNYVCEPP